MKNVPVFNVESKVDVKILVMIVVEDAVGLPWLPPLTLKGDSGMVDYSMVVDVHQHQTIWHKIDREDEHGRDVNALNEDEFDWVNCGHGECCWLLVSMMQFVEFLI